MGGECSVMVRFDLGPLLQGQMRTAKVKSAYNSLIIGPRGFGALSLRWIQFASVLRCARSSYNVVLNYKGPDHQEEDQGHQGGGQGHPREVGAQERGTIHPQRLRPGGRRLCPSPAVVQLHLRPREPNHRIAVLVRAR